MQSEFKYNARPKVEAIEQACAAWQRIVESSIVYNKDVLSTLGITGTQLILLRMIEANSPLSLKELTALTKQHVSTVGQMVDRMVKSGWIFRMQDSHDRRRIVLRTTRNGREILKNAPPDSLARLVKTMEAFSEEEAVGMADTIKKLADIFDVNQKTGD